MKRAPLKRIVVTVAKSGRGHRAVASAQGRELVVKRQLCRDAVLALLEAAGFPFAPRVGEPLAAGRRAAGG